MGPRRDRATWSLYGLLGLVGFLLNGLGAVLGPLQRDLHVGRDQVAYYPSLFAAGLLVVGIGGGAVVARLGRLTLARIALALLPAGALSLCSGSRPLTMVGAAVLGLGCAVVIQLVPAALSERHGATAPAALGEANALSSAAAVVGPSCVAVAIGVGAGWRVGFLVVPLTSAAVLAMLLRRMPPAPPQRGARQQSLTLAGLAPGGMLGRWTDLLLAISVEFCMVFWVADAVIAWHSASAAVAATCTALFLVGMAMVRAASQPLVTGRHPQRVAAASAALALVGFVGFWAAPSLPLAGLGLVVTGLGVGLLYPVLVARVVAAWPDSPDRAAARAAVASGLAIGGAPLVLAAMAHSAGLRAAYLLVPVLLVSLIWRATRALLRARRET